MGSKKDVVEPGRDVSFDIDDKVHRADGLDDTIQLVQRP